MITKIEFKEHNFQLRLNSDEVKKLISEIELIPFSKNYFMVNKNGKIYELVIDRDESGNLIIHYRGNIFIVQISRLLYENSSNASNEIHKDFVIKSPMPGLISKIKFNVGDTIKKGEGLLAIEAMKMENEIKSQVTGIIESIKVKVGTVVEKNAVLAIIKPIK